MNQTDWQGETERALRAITCEGCREGWLFDEVVTGDIHRKPSKFVGGDAGFIPYRCTSKHAELLPLFNAGIAGAYAAAAKAVHTIVGEAANQGEAERQWELKDRIAAEILALTPADARQAIEEIRTEAFERGENEENHFIAKQLIASAEARARQFQELADIVRTSHEHSIYHANGGRCRVCELLSEIPDTRGLAAARTPDSTQKEKI